MQNLFTKIQKCTAAVLTVLTVFATVSCSNDDEPAVTPDPQTFAGSLSTSIPTMPDFEPVTSEVSATITWLDPAQTSAKIDLGSFTIQTGMPGHGYEIGAMEITGITCTKGTDGVITLSQNSFSCQAGEYSTTGSLEGQYANGTLTFTIVYKPGAMPFDVKSTFTGK